jgi:hypothetical protein
VTVVWWNALLRRRPSAEGYVPMQPWKLSLCLLSSTGQNVAVGSKAPFSPSDDHFRSTPTSGQFQSPSAHLKGAKSGSQSRASPAPPRIPLAARPSTSHLRSSRSLCRSAAACSRRAGSPTGPRDARPDDRLSVTRRGRQLGAGYTFQAHEAGRAERLGLTLPRKPSAIPSSYPYILSPA